VATAARGAREVREARTRHTAGSSSTTAVASAPHTADDGAVRPDDEQVDAAGEVGQPVIERVLGGVVIGELDS